MSLPRVLVAAGVLVVLAACGGNNNPPPPQQATVTTTTATPAAPAAAPAAPPAAATASLAADDPRTPLMGTWAADPSSCGSLAITITPTRFEGAENQCDMAALTDKGDGSFTTTLTCTSAGQTAKERLSMRPLFAPSGEAIGLIYLDRKNQAATVYRCGAAPAPGAQ